MTARRKQEAVLRVLRGEPLEVVARELRVTAAESRSVMRFRRVVKRRTP